MRPLVLAAAVLFSGCGRGYGSDGAGGGSGSPCPPNAVRRTVCTECGPTDACLRSEDICAEVCRLSSQCTGLDTCFNGACQPQPCG